MSIVKTKKTILIYTMTMAYGGSERVIANLANHLCKKYKVILVTNIKTLSKYELDERIIFLNIDNKNRSKEIIIKKILTKLSLKRTRKLKEIILKYKPDTIITFLPEPTMRCLSIKHKYLKNSSVIVAVRNDPKFEYNYPFCKLLRNFYYKKADKFVFQTSSYMNYFNDEIKNKSYIIPNMISDEYFINPYINEREKKIVSVGRLVKQKNYKLLIDAFNSLGDDYKDYKLEIYGDGPLYDKLNNYIKKLSLSKRIKIYKGIKDVKSRIYKSSLFVLSSKYEGVSNSLIEAMALGIPVIATNSSLGISDLLKNNKIGLLLKNNSTSELTDNIKIALEKKENKKLSNQSLKIRNILKRNDILRKWEDVLNEKN